MSDRRPRLTCAVLIRQADRHLMGWLTWHLALGVDHIAVIDSGTCDRARQIIQGLKSSWPVSWHPVELQDGLAPEIRRLELTRQAIDHVRQVTQRATQPADEEAAPETAPADDWLLILDADEYLVPEHDLSDIFHRTRDDVTAIAIHWRIYGAAGHLTPPPGHVLAHHTWHALPAFADHQFVRLMARLRHLPDTSRLTDPLRLNLPEDGIRRINGAPYQPSEDVSPAELWSGGSIQHYVCAQAQSDEELPPPMRAHYDRNEQMTVPSMDRVWDMRRLANQMQEHALMAGLARLRGLVAQQVEEIRLHWEKNEADLPIENHVQHGTFQYDRVRPPSQGRLLLDEQFSSSYKTGQTVLLRSAEGRLLEGDQPDHREPFIGFWQASAPHILTLYTQEGTPFILGDAPCPFGMTSLHVSFNADRRVIHLPYETGHSSTPLEMIPASVPPVHLFTPLPQADEPEGLSVRGLLIWLAGHPDLRPHDLHRALLLLSPDSAQHMRNLAPILEGFLPPLPRAEFLPQ